MRQSLGTSRRRFLMTCGAACLAAPSHRRAEAQGQARAQTIEERIRELAEGAPLEMRFRGETAEECRKWQTEFATKLRSLLGRHAPPTRWTTETLSITELEDHRREEVVLMAEGHSPLPVYVLLPHQKADGPRPGILALHGHGPFGHEPVAGRDDLRGVAAEIKEHNYDYGRQLARRGYVVAA